MEFDRTRYVTPGLPRVRQGFAENFIYGLDNFPPSEMDLGLSVKQENPYLAEIAHFRSGRIARAFEKNEPVRGDLEKMALREFKINGALMNEALAIAEDIGGIQLTPSGIALLSKKRADEFKAVYRASAGLFGTSDYVLADAAKENPEYMRVLEALGAKAVDHFRKRLDGLQFVNLLSVIGADTGYDILRRQEQEFRFEDKILI